MAARSPRSLGAFECPAAASAQLHTLAHRLQSHRSALTATAFATVALALAAVPPAW
jgi:hypothetical protein